MVTEDGVPIDFTALEWGGDDAFIEELKRRTVGVESRDQLFRFIDERGGDDAFTEELKRRTAGMESIEQLFRFIEGFDGEWLNRKQMCVNG
nr:methyl-CpG-binding domain-containing protein 8-like isoform X2 [Ipomoea batatas]